VIEPIDFERDRILEDFYEKLAAQAEGSRTARIVIKKPRFRWLGSMATERSIIGV